MNNISCRQGIQYCKVDDSIAVIFTRTEHKLTIDSNKISINVEVINTDESDVTYDIKYYISKWEALTILNDWIAYADIIRFTTASMFDECSYFISRARNTHKMITNCIKKENEKYKIDSYKRYLEKIEREELFTIKMVDTEKDKDTARKIEKEKLKEKYRDSLLARRKIEQQSCNKYHKQLAELTLSKREGYHPRYIYHPKYPELDGLKGYHIDNDMVCTTMTKIMDAYNEYCQSEEYYL